MALIPCEQALQSDWRAKRAGGERKSERKTPAHRVRVSFLELLASYVPQMKSLLGGYGRYAEFIFEGKGSTMFRLSPRI